MAHQKYWKCYVIISAKFNIKKNPIGLKDGTQGRHYNYRVTIYTIDTILETCIHFKIEQPTDSSKLSSLGPMCFYGTALIYFLKSMISISIYIYMYFKLKMNVV